MTRPAFFGAGEEQHRRHCVARRHVHRESERRLDRVNRSQKLLLRLVTHDHRRCAEVLRHETLVAREQGRDVGGEEGRE